MGRELGLVVVVLAGCAHDVVPDAGVVDPVSGHCAAWFAAGCEAAKRCGLHSTAASCGVEFDCAEAYRDDLDAGVMRFDAQAAAACLAQYAGRDCQSRTLSPDVCADVFVGKAGLGEGCRGPCASGFICQNQSVGATCGACAAVTAPRYPAQGERCDSALVDGAGCAAGLECVGRDGGALACEPRRGLGAPCENHACEVGLFCATEDGGTSCVPFRELDEGCDGQHPCKGGIFCEAGRCTKRREVGAGCVDALGCESLACVNQTCIRSVVGDGENCGGNATCGAGLFCQGSTCAPRVGRGGACGAGLECQTGTECMSGVCRNRQLECR